MPIQLTSPLSVGTIDVNSPYQQVKILQINLLSAVKRIELTVQHGNTINGTWTPGRAIEGTTVQRFKILDSEYDTLIAAKSAGADEVYYDKVGALLYQWLLDEEHYVGTIV